MERLCVLVEVRPELRDKASLASFILGIETLPSEPALLKSHLNRLHTQRHAILSLVESVDLVKKGQKASQRTLVDFLSSAITSFNREEADEAVQISEGLGSSRYLLRFLEYLARVADLMHSAQDALEEAAGVTKLFDVLAEPPKGIVARLLFEMQGHRQAQVLSEPWCASRKGEKGREL